MAANIVYCLFCILCLLKGSSSLNCAVQCEQKHFIDDDYLNKTYTLTCRFNVDIKPEDIQWSYDVNDTVKERIAFFDGHIFGPFGHSYKRGYSELAVQVINTTYLTKYKVMNIMKPACNARTELKSKIHKEYMSASIRLTVSNLVHLILVIRVLIYGPCL